MGEENSWPTGMEPSLDELLSDPIVLALLRSDGLTRRCAEAVIARARRDAAALLLAPRDPEDPER